MKEFDGLKKMDARSEYWKERRRLKENKRTSSSLAAYRSTTARLFIDYDRRTAASVTTSSVGRESLRELTSKSS